MKILKRNLSALLLSCSILLFGLTCASTSPALEEIGAQNLPDLGDPVRDELSPIAERELGEEVMRDIRRDSSYLEDLPSIEYLAQIGQKLLNADPNLWLDFNYDFQFFLVRDTTLNAFALPGGFIGIHTGLILTAQSEAELAGVMSHEIGHVAQRHIARMLSKQRQDMLVPIVSAILGVLAARSNPDAGIALIAGGQGVALQRQLNFSRDAEREADRVGLQILKRAGYDPKAMAIFFGRLQKAAMDNEARPYLRTHPLTTERIADMQNRLSEATQQHTSDHLDSLYFALIQARLRVLQDLSASGLQRTQIVFETMLEKSAEEKMAAYYGLAFLALQQKNIGVAREQIKQAKSLSETVKNSTIEKLLLELSSNIELAANNKVLALNQAKQIYDQYPLSISTQVVYTEALLANQRYAEAIQFLRQQTSTYPQIIFLQLLAKAYAQNGQATLANITQAESYAAQGRWQKALDQLKIARHTLQTNFYEQSLIDAHEKDWKVKWQYEKSKQKNKP